LESLGMWVLHVIHSELYAPVVMFQVCCMECWRLWGVINLATVLVSMYEALGKVVVNFIQCLVILG